MPKYNLLQYIYIYMRQSIWILLGHNISDHCALHSLVDKHTQENCAKLILESSILNLKNMPLEKETLLIVPAQPVKYQRQKHSENFLKSWQM